MTEDDLPFLNDRPLANFDSADLFEELAHRSLCCLFVDVTEAGPDKETMRVHWTGGLAFALGLAHYAVTYIEKHIDAD